MAKHNVYVNLPGVELGKKDVFFDVYKDGKKFGTITISKGSIEWYPTHAKKTHKMGWSKFDKMVKEYHE